MALPSASGRWRTASLARGVRLHANEPPKGHVPARSPCPRRRGSRTIADRLSQGCRPVGGSPGRHARRGRRRAALHPPRAARERHRRAYPARDLLAWARRECRARRARLRHGGHRRARRLRPGVPRRARLAGRVERRVHPVLGIRRRRRVHPRARRAGRRPRVDRLGARLRRRPFERRHDGLSPGRRDVRRVRGGRRRGRHDRDLRPDRRAPAGRRAGSPGFARPRPRHGRPARPLRRRLARRRRRRDLGAGVAFFASHARRT